jgi:AmmeMemoRadiSam system protein B
MEKSILRIAKKSGTWYESSKEKLGEELREYLLKAKNTLGKKLETSKKVKAIICPHAGYYYSGPTAAYSFINLISDQMSEIKNIIVLGPSHHKYFKGCKISQCSALETPFGNLDVNLALAKELLNYKGFSTLDKSDDENEHSLEMQFPYIYLTLYEYNFKPKILPIMVGEIDSESALTIGKTLCSLLERDDTVFVISSDFCHWGSNFDYQPYSGTGEIHEYITRLDKEGINFIEKIDYQGFSNYLELTSNTICGRNPILLMLNTIQQSKFSSKMNVELLSYAQSGQVKRKNQSSVSYASVLFSTSI